MLNEGVEASETLEEGVEVDEETEDKETEILLKKTHGPVSTASLKAAAAASHTGSDGGEERYTRGLHTTVSSHEFIKKGIGDSGHKCAGQCTQYKTCVSTPQEQKQ